MRIPETVASDWPIRSAKEEEQQHIGTRHDTSPGGQPWHGDRVGFHCRQGQTDAEPSWARPATHRAAYPSKQLANDAHGTPARTMWLRRVLGAA
ncbi:MAG: hypothetical protein A2W31_10730 [Planctomycetes bacterium RBG_16_64_10]|nr:MAG: hypothetical protein A2W31_10730 [Planctomycetes bacterium RBG_16_64_10]